jgi:hypothetical protein
MATSDGKKIDSNRRIERKIFDSVLFENVRIINQIFH